MIALISAQLREYLLQKYAQKKFCNLQRYWKIERLLEQSYRFFSPYKQLCRLGEIYGETPIAVLETIANWLCDESDLPIYELGSGIGKSSFFLHELTKRKVIAIEQYEPFVTKARNIQKKFKEIEIDFCCGNYMQSVSSIFRGYCYGTALKDSCIMQLANNLPLFSKLVTVSYSLCEYSKNFYLLQEAEVCFPWGKTKIFLNEKRSL